MKDSELDDLLKTARTPERPPQFWDRFPDRVVAEIRRRDRSADILVRSDVGSQEGLGSVGWIGYIRGLLRTGMSARRGLGLAFVTGLAAACIVLGFILGFWRGQRAPASDAQLAAMQKYFHEIEGLFPNQVQAIVFDQAGAHLVLADRPDVPVSAPVYLKICDARSCRRFVTFSGQSIRVNGDRFDVLVSRQGEVLLVGEQSVWSSSQPASNAGRYRIEARPLPTTS